MYRCTLGAFVQKYSVKSVEPLHRQTLTFDAAVIIQYTSLGHSDVNQMSAGCSASAVQASRTPPSSVPARRAAAAAAAAATVVGNVGVVNLNGVDTEDNFSFSPACRDTCTKQK